MALGTVEIGFWERKLAFTKRVLIILPRQWAQSIRLLEWISSVASAGRCGRSGRRWDRGFAKVYGDCRGVKVFKIEEVKQLNNQSVDLA